MKSQIYKEMIFSFAECSPQYVLHARVLVCSSYLAPTYKRDPMQTLWQSFTYRPPRLGYNGNKKGIGSRPDSPAVQESGYARLMKTSLLLYTCRNREPRLGTNPLNCLKTGTKRFRICFGGTNSRGTEQIRCCSGITAVSIIPAIFRCVSQWFFFIMPTETLRPLLCEQYYLTCTLHDNRLYYLTCTIQGNQSIMSAVMREDPTTFDPALLTPKTLFWARDYQQPDSLTQCV